MKASVQVPNSRFIEVQCRKCKNEQVIFSKASIVVKCLKCGEELAVPTGGVADIRGKVLKVLS